MNVKELKTNIMLLAVIGIPLFTLLACESKKGDRSHYNEITLPTGLVYNIESVELSDKFPTYNIRVTTNIVLDTNQLLFLCDSIKNTKCPKSDCVVTFYLKSYRIQTMGYAMFSFENSEWNTDFVALNAKQDSLLETYISQLPNVIGKWKDPTWGSEGFRYILCQEDNQLYGYWIDVGSVAKKGVSGLTSVKIDTTHTINGAEIRFLDNKNKSTNYFISYDMLFLDIYTDYQENGKISKVQLAHAIKY